MLMNSNIVLDVRNVYKKYGKNNSATRELLKDELKYIFTKKKSKKLRKNEFWVLDNISFQLKRGETLGILGLNGSGKSTLLKMINGLLLPDFGEIYIDGEVGGFIELGAGFQSELSGKQNIFIKGALLGKSKEEMQKLYDDIVGFAEIGDFINTPVKNYSSGMKARLGFGILVHIKPDILLMDEVLAVGDYKFRAKCMAKLNELREDISSILVSHSMQDIRQYCDRAIILEKGNMIFSGKVDYAIERYIEQQNKSNKKNLNKTTIKPFYGEFYYNEKKVLYFNVVLLNKSGNKINELMYGESLIISISFRLNISIESLQIGVPIWNSKGEFVINFDNYRDGYEFGKIQKNKLYTSNIHINTLELNPDSYTIIIVLVNKGEPLLRMPINDKLIIRRNKHTLGIYEPKHQWSISEKFN